MIPALLVVLVARAQEGEPPPEDRDEALLFGGPTTPGEPAIEVRLDEADQALTLGGQLTLRTTASLPDGEGEPRLSSPNLLDLFLDARPDDRLRAYVRARLVHDWTVTDGETDAWGRELSTNQIVLDQLWLKFDIARAVFVTAGRQRIKWGTGRFWNPTDFLNTEVRDPLAVADLRTGVSLLKLHAPLGQVANLYALASLDQADAPSELGAAARAELLVGRTELALSGAVREQQPLRLGADLSMGVGIFDVRLEGAVRHGEADPSYEGSLDPETGEFPETVDRDEDWIPQVTGGLDVTFRLNAEDTLSLGAEALYNDAGYDDPSLYPWLVLNGAWTPFYVGRMYAAAWALLPAPGRWTHHSFTLSGLANLSDLTGLVRLQHTWAAQPWLDVSTWATAYLGEKGEFHTSLSIPAIEGVEGLEEGLELTPDRGEVGVWAEARF